MPRGVATAAVLHLFVAGLASGSLAQEPHLDVAVQENAADGRPSVHGFDFDVLPQFGIVVDKRVFGRSFGISGNSLITDDPGFVSRTSPVELNPAGLFPVREGEPLRFNVLAAPSTLPELGGRNLSFWDGTGTVAWSAVPDTEELKIFTGPFANPTDEVVADGSTTDLPGFVIGGTSGSGSLHEHIKFLLLPDGLALPPAGPDDGVYLVLVELGYPSYEEWIPTWLTFKAFAGNQSTLDLAVADVEASFLRPLCDDGIDNDKDGMLDLDDPGCEDELDGSEWDEGGGDETLSTWFCIGLDPCEPTQDLDVDWQTGRTYLLSMWAESSEPDSEICGVEARGLIDDRWYSVEGCQNSAVGGAGVADCSIASGEIAMRFGQGPEPAPEPTLLDGGGPVRLGSVSIAVGCPVGSTGCLGPNPIDWPTEDPPAPGTGVFSFAPDGAGCTDARDPSLASNDVLVEIDPFSGCGLLGIEVLVVLAVARGWRRGRLPRRCRRPGD